MKFIKLLYFVPGMYVSYQIQSIVPTKACELRYGIMGLSLSASYYMFKKLHDMAIIKLLFIAERNRYYCNEGPYPIELGMKIVSRATKIGTVGGFLFAIPISIGAFLFSSFALGIAHSNKSMEEHKKNVLMMSTGFTALVFLGTILFGRYSSKLTAKFFTSQKIWKKKN